MLRFVDSWKKRTGRRPEELVFDSRLTLMASSLYRLLAALVVVSCAMMSSRAIVSCVVVVGLGVVGGAQAAEPDHWAFRVVQRPAAPAVRDALRVGTDVDRFVQARLEDKGLSLGPDADRATLLRRVANDLTGLPPTLAEIAAFLADPGPRAYERMVERYLASPHYGERWAQHWLDAVGYADSNGYFHADTDRPLAYKYRDYIIGAFNADKPFDRFLHEQIAGDELAGWRPGGDVTPEMVEPLTATHFLRNGPDGTGESDGNDLERQTDRIRVVEALTEITGSALLGLTLKCARCHDHKFDPITQQEYYRLQAVFTPALTPDPKRWIKPQARLVTVGTKAEREAHRQKVEAVNQEIEPYKKSLTQFAGPLRERRIEQKLAALDDEVREAVRKAWQADKSKRTDAQKALLEKHKKLLEVSDDELAKHYTEYAALRKSVQAKLAALEKTRPGPLPKLAVVAEMHDGEPLPHHLLERGVYAAPGPVVEPGVFAAFCTDDNDFRVEPFADGRKSTGRRTALARWLTSRSNPLVARVMVNRIWMHHFGQPLVATPANFGRSGTPPTHPGLLDHLAASFMDDGWSIKAVHRLILHSTTYRQSSALREAAHAADPQDRLLWRYPMHRLDAEAVRDGMLAVSGELDRRRGGPYVPVRRERDGRVAVDEKHEGAKRRSIYLQHRRTQMPTMLELFDAPAITKDCPERGRATIPLQSLAQLNADFVVRRAAAFAARVRREAGPRRDERITHAFLLALGRGPTDAERAATEAFLPAQQQNYADDKAAEQRVWADFCQMLFASSAFLYVE